MGDIARFLAFLRISDIY